MAIQVSLEGYDSLEQIGVGGMAAVYKARKISIGKVVAVKVLFPYLANDESYIERFQREARSAAKLQHENIVNVIDFGDSDGAYYIVMEYYDGLTLADILKRQQTVPLDISILILLEVCLGLEAAHAKNVIHRDIKPGNIICTQQGGVKIADFGLAKNSEGATVVTQPGKVIGTPAFMSPEQAAGQNINPQSDIFSLGVVAYELFCNKRPFEGDSYSAVLEQIQTVDPPPLVELNPLVQPELEQIVRKMLAKDLSKRYQRATDVVSDLERAMDKFQVTRDRRRLAKYLKNPTEYESAFKEKLISRSLSQGMFFLQKGKAHLEDAKLEFMRILYLDPENERAKKYLSKILSELGQDDQTVTVEQVAPRVCSPGAPRKDLKGTREKQRTGPRSARTPPRASKKKKQFWVVPLFVIVLLGAFFPLWRDKVPLRGPFEMINKAPVISAPAELTISEGETIEFVLQAADAEGDTVIFSAEKLPREARLSDAGLFVWQVAYDQAGTHRIRFHASDGNNVSKTETVINAKDTPLSLDFATPGKHTIREGQELKLTLAAASSLDLPVTFKLLSGPEGMTVRENRLNWKPAKGQTGTFRATVSGTDGYAEGSQTVEVRVRPDVKKPAAKLEWGRLSVYFLGGIGEFRMDGNKFEKQPPFTGVPVAAGRHTVLCRMLKDGSTKEFQITVKPGEETVIEYELGKEPVVSQGEDS